MEGQSQSQLEIIMADLYTHLYVDSVAGAGKTRTMMNRVAKGMTTLTNVTPSDFAIVSLTNVATNELHRRWTRTHDTPPQICTIHQLCAGILRNAGKEFCRIVTTTQM